MYIQLATTLRGVQHQGSARVDQINFIGRARVRSTKKLGVWRELGGLDVAKRVSNVAYVD